MAWTLEGTKKAIATITKQLKTGKNKEGKKLTASGRMMLECALVTQQNNFAKLTGHPKAALAVGGATKSAKKTAKKKAAKIVKGSGEPNRTKVGKVTKDQVREIAQLKFKDLNAVDLEGAIRTVEGTARSMGIEVVD